MDRYPAINRCRTISVRNRMNTFDTRCMYYERPLHSLAIVSQRTHAFVLSRTILKFTQFTRTMYCIDAL